MSRASPLVLTLASGLLLYSAACAAGARPAPFSPRSGFIDLTVENAHVMDMRVYLLRGATPVPLGTVGTLERRRFRIEPGRLGSSGMLRLMVDPVGSSRRVELPPQLVAAGQSVECRLAHDLKHTTFHVR